MSDVWAVPAFFAVKCLAYTAYCYGGLAWFHRSVDLRVSYGLVRYLEWGLLAYLVSGRTVPSNRRAVSWSLGGVVLSFLTDWIGFSLAIRIVGGIC